MGNSNSTPLQKCLNTVFEGNSGSVAFPNNPLYQILDVKPYNLDIIITPAAVTHPKSAEQIAEIVKCAVDSHAKVQARSGGHSYGNYGT